MRCRTRNHTVTLSPNRNLPLQYRPNSSHNLLHPTFTPPRPVPTPGAGGANSGVESVPSAGRVPPAAVQSHHRGGSTAHRGEEAAGEGRLHRLQLLKDRRPVLLRDVRGAGVARHQGHALSGTETVSRPADY